MRRRRARCSARSPASPPPGRSRSDGHELHPGHAAAPAPAILIASLDGGPMELKTARLTLLIDPNKKAAFERLCAQQDLTPSQVVRRLIRDYLAHHGASYQPSGED